jgi:hypothetical protein
MRVPVSHRYVCALFLRAVLRFGYVLPLSPSLQRVGVLGESPSGQDLKHKRKCHTHTVTDGHTATPTLGM